MGFPYVLPSSLLGVGGEVAPSNRITLGLIGTGNINTHHREAFLAEKDTRIVAVCDPVTERRESHRDCINHAYGDAACADYRDFRELLAREDIDAVCIGTPDHWHAAHAIAAMQAGKDVYVEKPLTLTVAEGRRVAEVAAMYGRVLQTGLQHRSGGAYRYACELVRNGRIGRLTRVEVGIIGINKGVQVGQNFPGAPVPDDFDYDLWLGPVKYRPYKPMYLPGAWRDWLAFGTGRLGDHNCHELDGVAWALDLDLPETIEADTGPTYDVRQNTETYPNTSTIRYRFPAKGKRPGLNVIWHCDEPLPQL
ncbi:MAG: Gfo/Idh/MocA family oxidoreductase, partial [Planctomycetota bacterium]